MRISKVSLYHKKIPMICGRFSCSLEPGVEKADVVITRVETDAGLVGYGESGSVGGYPNYACGILESSAELIERHLMDKDPREVNANQHLMSLIDGHGAIKAGFDMACWDLLGKSLDQPLHAVLGGRLHDRVPLYRSIPTEAPTDMVRSVQDWRLEGYRSFQLRVGHGDVHEDLRRIAGVIGERSGDEIYTVDVAGHWRVDEALFVLNAVEDLDFTIEQPCWTIDDCISVRERVHRPLKLDNSINSVHDALRAYARGACDSMVVHLNKFGGITPARTARDLAIAGGLGITFSTQWGTEITTAALTHLSMTTPPNRLLATIDIHNYSSLAITSNNPVVVDNGFMWMADDAPGLGVVVNDAALGEPDRVIG